MKSQNQKQNENNLRSSTNFFHNQEYAQNKIIVRLFEILFVFPVLLLFFRLLGIYSGISYLYLVIFISIWLFNLFLVRLIMKYKPFAPFVKYLLAFTCEFLIIFFSVTYGFHVFILFLLVPVMSCLYFNKKFSIITVVLCYLSMIGSIAYRAFFIIEERGFKITPIKWFSYYCVSGTIGYIVISFAIVLIVKRNRTIINTDYNEIQKNLTAQNTISSSYVAMLCEKNNTIEGHIKRCCDYVRIIVNNLQATRKFSKILTDEMAYQIISASLLHDIGLIKVPDSIMDKKTPFTSEEQIEMKKHTVYGEELLRTNMQAVEENYLNLACDMVLYHHEHFDGTGGPMGLKGEEIPLSARIMAVANGIDVLLNGSPTSESMEFEKAMDELLQQAGTLYDPVIVNAALNCQKLIHEVADR